jgi:hypothetical protein
MEHASLFVTVVMPKKIENIQSPGFVLGAI